MNVSLFVPCYVDQLAPRVAWATLGWLERLGCQVHYDAMQRCCGQPLLNAGGPEAARPLALRFLETFATAEYVVAPSASCVATVRRHYASLLEATPEAAGLAVSRRVWELCEFVVEVLGVERVEGRFSHKVGLHPSCHGLRELGLGSPSEAVHAGPLRDPAALLLGSLEGAELVEPARRDECCGFGGSFAVSESAVSGAMGRDRVRAHLAAGTEVLTATDASCLMHLEGIARREDAPLRVMHVAEIFQQASQSS